MKIPLAAFRPYFVVISLYHYAVVLRESQAVYCYVQGETEKNGCGSLSSVKRCPGKDTVAGHFIYREALIQNPPEHNVLEIRLVYRRAPDMAQFAESSFGV